MTNKSKQIALNNADIASAVNSVLRIISTIIIYVFHCDGQFGVQSTDSLFYAFAFFLFISGYYSFFQNESPNKWIIKRLKRIYIPYWIVISCAVIANSFFDYKDIGFVELLFAFIGGNLFVEHKIYVIAWFISVIVCFYICVYVYKKISILFAKSILIISIILLLLKFDIPYYFFISFILGYAIHAYIFYNTILFKEISTNLTSIKIFYSISHSLLLIQNYSYEFFLVHGGVILFFTKVFHATYTVTMYGGIFFSLVGAIVLKVVAKQIELFFRKYLVNPRLSLNVST